MSASPVFCATFADGETVRMSVHHSEGRASFDLARGVKLARYAYETRQHNAERRQGFDGPPVAVPPIVSASYQDGDTVLVEYDAAQIEKAAP